MTDNIQKIPPVEQFEVVARDFVEHEPCYDEDCLRYHNESGHHYGCECSECMREYWMLKR